MPELLEGERALLQEITTKWEIGEDYAKPFLRHCDELYGQYRAYQGLRDNLHRSDPPDRDEILRGATKDWGADLAIPVAYWTVETIVSRAVGHRPRMVLTPHDEDAMRNIANMKFLIDYQQSRNRYELVNEETCKRGEIYGLAIQKQTRRTEHRQHPWLVETLDPQTGAKKWVERTDDQGNVLTRQRCDYDGWWVDNVDIADFRWNPLAKDADSLQWCVHRLWLSTTDVLERVADGRWPTEAIKRYTASEIAAMASANRYDEGHRERMSMAGFDQSINPREENHLHEVWEYWDRGGRVVTVLDRTVPVQSARSPYRHGQMPFAFFRPSTSGIDQLAGIGSVEPLDHLIRELNTLRSQRRDNAALTLQRVVAFAEGSMDPANMQMFPGAAWPTPGEPRELIYPIEVPDIPHSSYREEERILADLERASGISDTTMGAASGGSQTATGEQMVQAAAGARIARHTVRLEVECVKRMAEQAVLNNQTWITEPDQYPETGPPEPGSLVPSFKMRTVGPAELMGFMAIEPDAGSMAAKNMPQQIELARTLNQMFGQDEKIDQRMLKLRTLELVGMSQPEAWVVPDEPRLSPDILKRLEAAGVDPELIGAAVARSQAENPPTEGQPTNQEPAMNGASGGGPS